MPRSPDSPTMSVRSPVSFVSHGEFASHGEYFVSCGAQGIQIWRAGDSESTIKITGEQVQCVAFSKDGKWIAAGTFRGYVIIWDTKVYKQTHATWNTTFVVRGVDFSPDSTRLCAWGDNRAAVWNIASRELVLGPLPNERICAAKYSPQSNQIATATQNFVRVYDRNHTPVDIPVRVTTRQYNTALLWSNQHIFVISEGKIKQIDPSRRSIISEWRVPDTNNYSCITMPKHGQFIAYSADNRVTFWDTSTHSQLGHVDHPREIYSIALSPDGRFLAIGEEDGTITTRRLSRIIEPDIEIDDNAFHSWMREALSTEGLLTKVIPTSRNARHLVLAGQSLVHVRLGQWDEAIADAEESITAQPSVMGFIAKSVWLVNEGMRSGAYRACDLAFEYTHPTHVSFLLLVKAVIVCMAGDHDDAISRVGDLTNTLTLNSICHVVQAHMHLLLGKVRMANGNFDDAIQSFERARDQLPHHASRALSLISLISGWNFDDIDITAQQGHCDALYAAGRMDDAGESLLKMINIVNEEVYMRKSVTNWVFGFLQRYLSDGGSSLPLLREWARLTLARYSWDDALSAATSFMSSRFVVYRVICEELDTRSKTMDATKCFHRMMNELNGEINQHAERAEWAAEFRGNLLMKLERRGDGAMHAEHYQEAIDEYSAAMSLDPASPQRLYIKRSKANIAMGLWKSGLQDADKVIAIDPSSPWGYERKHAALHKARRYDDAIRTFETMLLKIKQSPDPKIRERESGYVSPARTNAVIRKAVQDTIRNTPRVLIHTESGRLYDKSKQASWFESLPVFKELISSMTTDIDYTHIQREVEEYYRYATFSHTWEDNEPLFEKVVHVVVYGLDESFTHKKLQTFCKIARKAGLNWAWSDTCCINKGDHFVLQEALVAMFKWYEGSAVTIIFLRGVHSPSRRGDLMRSIWNTRGWTFQEYHASKVVRFYTEEWELYLDLDIPNHKDSPEIISEMEEAAHVSARFLKELRPGLQHIREKLCLASRRETTFVEDAAYALLGIFSVTVPILYGEGDQALGKLLAQLLTSSGDTRILAWTGKSGSFNSCLPASITVFNELPAPHIPRLTGAEIETMAPRLRPSSPSFTLVLRLHDQLRELVPSFANQRMKLPCLTFKLGPVRSKSEHVFQAKADALGVVEIMTMEDLSQYHSLILVHPWIDFLLDRRPVNDINETTPDDVSQINIASSTSRARRPSDTFDIASAVTKQKRGLRRLAWPFGAGDSDSLLSPSPESQEVRQARALEFTARLRQPFGALLFTPMRHHVEEYRRVASESLIRVQVAELSSTVLNNLIDGARMLDVL